MLFEVWQLQVKSMLLTCYSGQARTIGLFGKACVMDNPSETVHWCSPMNKLVPRA